MAEQVLHITGGRPLQGEVSVQGAKNSALPLIAASILCDGDTQLTNVPRLTDVWAAGRILNRLGCHCVIDGHTVAVANAGLSATEIADADMRSMRSSIMFLGPILGKTGACTLTVPGGCELGPRPIDYHLDAMRALGAQITDVSGAICCRAKRLTGGKLALPFPSVGVTENILMAACLAKGDTVLTNAAREPEIVDLANFLNQCGAQIAGAGEGQIVIHGVTALHGTEYAVMPDRIVAMTGLCACAAAGGTVCVKDVCPVDMVAGLSVLEAAGCRLGICKDRVFLDAGAGLRAIRYLRTMPHPGFPTDAQALMMVVLCGAKGSSVIEETIFESRYKHVGELLRMGADIRVSGRTAVVNGVSRLHGATVEAMDLRGGAALAIAGLCAEGETVVRGLSHVARGYERLDHFFHSLGGMVECVSFS